MNKFRRIRYPEEDLRQLTASTDFGSRMSETKGKINFTWGQFHQHFSRAAFMHKDPKSTKIQSSGQSFCAFGIYASKS